MKKNRQILVLAALLFSFLCFPADKVLAASNVVEVPLTVKQNFEENSNEKGIDLTGTYEFRALDIGIPMPGDSDNDRHVFVLDGNNAEKMISLQFQHGGVYRYHLVQTSKDKENYTYDRSSYIIDVYRGNVKVQKNILNFALYVTMFPQLIAGPIVQYADVEEQLVNRESSWDKFGEGCMYFIRGLAKKVLLANTSGMIFTEVTGLGKGNVSVLSAWLGAFAYMFQIYFDFSGYSDMAVGLGKMFGFEFCMNFNYPYIAKSITEFWRRWHISLSSWFRDYVYIPLGGNRVSKSRHIFNLMVVWFLTGLWHGAAWNFVAWGLYYGIILIIEKYILSPVLDKLPSVVRHIYSIVLVVIGWVLFFSPSLGGAARYLGMMFGAGAHGVADRESLYLLTTNLVLWIILIIGSTPLTDVRYQHMLRRKKWNTTLLNGIVYAVLFILCIAYLVTETYNPFLYFRF